MSAKKRGEFLVKLGRFESSKAMRVWFPLMLLNLLGMGIALGLPYGILDANNMITHTFKAELKPEGYRIDVLLNDTGTYVVKGTDIDLVGINCGASFSILGVSSVLGTAEQQLGRCTTGQADRTVHVLETIISGGSFRVTSLRDGWSINAPAVLKSGERFEIQYVAPPWTLLIYVGLVLWGFLMLVVCYVGNMFFRALLVSEYERVIR